MELKQHPLSAAFPAMSAEDFQALKDDIEVNGQREPIMLFDGMVLDGWHRYRACIDLGIKPQQFTFTDKDPVAFVLSTNLHRRHLTASQRAAAVVACSSWAPAHRPKSGEPVPHLTTKEMAKAAQVSDKTIKQAKTAHKAGLTDAVKAGALTVKQAAQVARGTPEPEKKLAPWDKLPEPTLQPALDEAHEAVQILSEENDRLNDRLAVEAMDASEEEKGKAAETIAALRADLKTANAELSAVKASRDTYMRENAELKKTVAALQRKLRKLEVPA
jgi:DNA repair exonuclease SbcCD ATPase subunit